jgi:hypothetical protein
MSRYESRLQRVHDKAYAALRELQESRPTPTTHSPSVSEGFPSVEDEISPNEPAAPPLSSPDIPLYSRPGHTRRKFGGS